MNSYGQSGFRDSSEMNPNFEFGSGTIEEGTFSLLSSSVSRARTGKSRKSGNLGLMGRLETQKNDLGFNPFHPGLDDLSGVSSGLERDELGDNRNKHLNLKVTNRVEKGGNVLVDEIRRLRIENETDSRVGGRNASDLSERGSATLSGIQQHGKGGKNSLPPELPDCMEKLNLGGSGVMEASRGGIREARSGSRGGRNVGGSFGTDLASELPNELNKLNLKDPGEVGSQNFVFTTSTSSSRDFVFGNRKSNDKVDPGITSTLPDKIKNLNIEDLDKSDGAQNELNVNKGDRAFDSGDHRNGSGSGGVIDPMILDEIERLKIGDNSELSVDHADLDNSSTLMKEPLENMSKEDAGKPNQPKVTSIFGDLGKHSGDPNVVHDQSDKDPKLQQSSVPSMTSFPSAGPHFQPVRDEFKVPSMDGTEKKPGLGFSCKHDGSVIPPVEFRTPDPKGSLFTGSNQNIKFTAKKGAQKDNLCRGRKGKLKEPTPVLSFWKNISQMENNLQDSSQPSESFSPMDVSPCGEIQDDKQSAAETSLMSDDQPSTAPPTAYSDDLTDEDLARATECMDINKDNDVKDDEPNVQVSECSVSSCAPMSGSLENSSSDVETENLESASENLDTNEENEVESTRDLQNCHTQYFSTSSSVSSGGLSFTFAASSSAQGQASSSMRHHRKKSRMKAGPDINIPTRSAVLSDATSSLQLSPIPRGSALPSPVGKKDVLSPIYQKEGDNLKAISHGRKTPASKNVEDTNKETMSPTAASRAAQEACDKWRLRGNQAYSNGDLETAEDYYSQGLSCIPQNETSLDCRRAMVLCYSNRAATRMSLGRMRDALRDCLVASQIDPQFFRVQLRAANCYLALGEVDDASRYFKKFLQSNDVCVDRKLILEASDGIQKAQKVSECMNRSAELLQQRMFTDVESALGLIAEALVISPYSEQLLERKATALFMLRRYEEVIQMCEQTLKAAEKNSALWDGNEQSSKLEASELLKNYSFQIWRYSHIFKSNFYLGKLEEALDFLEKQEQWKSMVNKYGHDHLESLIPQVSIARELIRYKSAGNEAFQVGRHTEAVEHYTAALSLNVESRPFSAVFFGNRAAAYQALGQIIDAIADCSLAIALDGNYVKAISRRATLFEMIRDYEQAAKDLQRFVSLFNKQLEEKANPSGAALPINSLADLRQARQRLFQMEEQARKGLPLNFYLILGVEASVTAADLKKAYRKAALRHHPDKAGQLLARSESGDDGLWKEIAEEVHKDADRLFKMIGEAYAVLSDPTKRSQYDIEEETRNGQRKSNVSRMHTHTDAPPFYTAERGGSGSRSWHEPGRSSANPYSRGFEPTRSSRYY